MSVNEGERSVHSTRAQQVLDNILQRQKAHMSVLATMRSGEVSDRHLQLVNDLREAVVAVRDAPSGTDRSDKLVGLVEKSVDVLLDGMAVFARSTQLSAESEFIDRFVQGATQTLLAFQRPEAFGQEWVARRVSSVFIEMPAEKKYFLDALDTLFKHRLAHTRSLDEYFARCLTLDEEAASDDVEAVAARHRERVALVEFLMNFCSKFFIRESLQLNVQEVCSARAC